MGKKCVENFHIFTNLLDHNPADYENKKEIIPKDHFNLYKELHEIYKKAGHHIFYHFLNKVYDSEERDIMNMLPLYLRELHKYFNKHEMSKGMSTFLKVVPDLANDYPKLSQYLSHTFLALKDAHAFVISEIVWLEPPKNEDEVPFVEQYYHLMAELLKLTYTHWEGRWKDVAHFFHQNKLHEKFKAMEQYILEDNLFDDIA